VLTASGDALRHGEQPGAQQGLGGADPWPVNARSQAAPRA